MKHIVIASHHRYAAGLKDTLEFVLGEMDIATICAYVDDEPLSDQVDRVFSRFGPDDEVLVLTDMLQGSVNQALRQYVNERVHVITGVNLPLAIELAVETRPLTPQVIDEAISKARDQLVYVNELSIDVDDEDE